MSVHDIMGGHRHNINELQNPGYNIGGKGNQLIWQVKLFSSQSLLVVDFKVKEPLSREFLLKGEVQYSW